MNYKILTKIDRDLLNLDPASSRRSQLRHLAWGRSSLTSNDQILTKKYRKNLKLGYLLANFREKLLSLKEETQKKPFIQQGRPQLPPPILPPKGTFRPPRYFSRGAVENNRKKNPTPILYLLTETNEISKARPVPGNSLLLRSLCKGKGALRRTDKGFVYLDVDDRFILSLIPYLKTFGLVKPPYFNLFMPPEGAHIPIIPAREAAFHYLEKVDGIDQEFSFEIEGLYSVEPTLWPEVEQVWFFKVYSEELEAFRRRNFLLSKPAGHSFHIAVAIKPRLAAIKREQRFPIMRINTAYLAA